MRIAKRTKLAATVVTIALFGAGASRIGARADGKAPPEGTFRVAV